LKKGFPRAPSRKLLKRGIWCGRKSPVPEPRGGSAPLKKGFPRAPSRKLLKRGIWCGRKSPVPEPRGGSAPFEKGVSPRPFPKTFIHIQSEVLCGFFRAAFLFHSENVPQSFLLPVMFTTRRTTSPTTNAAARTPRRTGKYFLKLKLFFDFFRKVITEFCKEFFLISNFFLPNFFIDT